MIEGLAPGATVEFDEGNILIRFRVQHGSVSLIPYSGMWEPAELAQKTDEWLRKLIHVLSDVRSNRFCQPNQFGPAAVRSQVGDCTQSSKCALWQLTSANPAILKSLAIRSL